MSGAGVPEKSAGVIVLKGNSHIPERSVLLVKDIDSMVSQDPQVLFVIEIFYVVKRIGHQGFFISGNFFMSFRE